MRGIPSEDWLAEFSFAPLIGRQSAQRRHIADATAPMRRRMHVLAMFTFHMAFPAAPRSVVATIMYTWWTPIRTVATVAIAIVSAAISMSRQVHGVAAPLLFRRHDRISKQMQSTGRSSKRSIHAAVIRAGPIGPPSHTMLMNCGLFVEPASSKPGTMISFVIHFHANLSLEARWFQRRLRGLVR